MSVIVSSSACKCGGIMVKSLLFDGRQQRVWRPSNDGCDGRHTMNITVKRVYDRGKIE